MKKTMLMKLCAWEKPTAKVSSPFISAFLFINTQTHVQTQIFIPVAVLVVAADGK